MADEPNLGQLDAAAIKEAAEKSAESDRTKSFLERAGEQLKRAGQRAVEGYLKGISEGGLVGDSVFAGAQISQTLQGTFGVEDATRVRGSEQVQPIPRQERIPNITLNISRIRTGLGMEVDRTLQRSQDEVVTAITQTWNVMKDRVYGLQKTVTILDKNVRVVDTKVKRFQSDVSSEVDRLKVEIRKLQQRPEPDKLLTTGQGPEKKDEVTQTGSLAGLTRLAPALGWLITAMPTLAAMVAAYKIYQENTGEIKEKGWGGWLRDNPLNARPGPEGERWFKEGGPLGLFGGYPGEKERIEKRLNDAQKSWWNRPTNLFGAGSAQAAERPDTTATSKETSVVEQTQVNLTAKESILVRAAQSVSIQAPKITIEAAEIIFKGRVTGLPEKVSAGTRQATGIGDTKPVGALTGYAVGARTAADQRLSDQREAAKTRWPQWLFPEYWGLAETKTGAAALTDVGTGPAKTGATGSWETTPTTQRSIAPSAQVGTAAAPPAKAETTPVVKQEKQTGATGSWEAPSVGAQLLSGNIIGYS